MPDLAGSRILVIGGAGFIGSHVVDLLCDEPVASIRVLDSFVRGRWENLAGALRDPRVEVVEADIGDRAALAAAVDGSDLVLHLAAVWLGECLNDPRRALEQNVAGTFNVVEACHRAGVRRLVFSSSASVYGQPLREPMDEDHPFNNRTMYGTTKIAGEQMLRAFHDQHGLDYVALRYFNVYGPRMDEQGVYVSVIARALRRLQSGAPPVVFGDGSQAYDFVDVTDVARANVLALRADVTDAAYNVATGRATSVLAVVDELIAITGADVAPDYRPAERSLVTRRCGGTAAAQRDLGFRALVDWRAGLRALAAARQAPVR